MEVARDCTAVKLTDALTREMSVIHESGRSISSADFCLTAVQSAVLFLKLLTILNPLNLLILCGTLLVRGADRAIVTPRELIYFIQKVPFSFLKR